MVEQWTFNPLVAGSNPARPTKNKPLPTTNKHMSSLDSIIKQVSQLSPQEKALLQAYR
jgi:hypothetical protein